MNTLGPIIVIDDDVDDQELMDEIFAVLKYPNPVLFFTNGNEAIDAIQNSETKPVLIISDINMPAINGFQLRKKILLNDVLRKIPFVFLTTGVDGKAAQEAHSLTCGGIFKKPNSMQELRIILKKIMDYWQVSGMQDKSIAA